MEGKKRRVLIRLFKALRVSERLRSGYVRIRPLLRVVSHQPPSSAQLQRRTGHQRSFDESSVSTATEDLSMNGIPSPSRSLHVWSQSDTV